MNSRKYTFLFFFISGFFLMGQDINPSLLPPSPGTAALAKFGSIPMTYYNGLPNIQIPLYEVRSGKAILPITLRYHAQGVKVNDVNGYVGLGWALDAGGHFLHQVKGAEDISEVGGFASITDIHSAVGNQTWQELEVLYCQLADNQPDIYSFSTPSVSGKFYYDKNGNVRFISRVPALVERNQNGALFTITDESGLKYYFDSDDVETQSVLSLGGSFDCVPPQGVTKTLMLSRMSSLDGKNISFEYESINYDYLNSFDEVDYPSQNALGYQKSQRWNGVSVAAKRLKKIISDSGYIVEFEYTGSGPGLLENMLVRFVYQGDTSTIKTVNFDYGLYGVTAANKPSDNLGGYYNSRNYLRQINESGKGITSFGYYTTQIPPRFSYAQDYWGYYNGANENTSLIPNVLPTGDLVSNLTGSTGDRRGNADYMKYGVLNEMIYPTGGKTTFEYGTNEVTIPGDVNGCTQEWVTKHKIVELVGGQNCNNIQELADILNVSSNAQNLQVSFSSNFNDPDNSWDVGIITCQDGFDDNNNPLVYLDVQLKDDQQNVLLQINDVDHPGGSFSNISGDIIISMKAAGFVPQAYNNQPEDGDENLEVRFVFQWQEFVTTCPPPGETMTQSIGGLRLKSKTDFGKVNNHFSEPIITRYKYFDPIYTLPKFVSKTGGWAESFGGDPCVGDAISDPVLVCSSSSVIPHTGFFGGSVAYGRVEEITGSGLELIEVGQGDVIHILQKQILGKKVYVYEHEQDHIVFDPIFGFGETVDRSHARGILKENWTYGYDLGAESYYPESVQINEYSKQKVGSIYGIKIAKLRASRQHYCSGGFNDPEYSYVHFERSSNWNYITNATSTKYIYDNELQLVGTKTSTTEFMNYNQSNLKPEKVVQTNDGIITTTLTEYDTTIALSTPKEIVTRRNITGNEVQLSKVTYDYQSPATDVHLLRTVLKRAETLIVEGYLVDYDNNHRISTVKNSMTDIETSYSYESNLDLITGVCNNCSEVFVESFEFHPSSVFDANAKSGDKVFNGYQFIVNGHSGFRVSYWKKSNLMDEWEQVTEVMGGSTHTIQVSGYIDNVVVYPPGGFYETYTHKPGWGISSKVDMNGVATYYNYDNAGRVIQVLDNERNVLSQTNYQILNH